MISNKANLVPRTAVSHPIVCGEAWNSSVNGDSFCLVTYCRNISRISNDDLISPIFIFQTLAQMTRAMISDNSELIKFDNGF